MDTVVEHEVAAAAVCLKVFSKKSSARSGARSVARGSRGAFVEVDLEQEVNLAEVEVDLEQGVVLEQGLASMELSTVWISEITFERAVREVVQVSSWQV
jgi:hypothetical protein